MAFIREDTVFGPIKSRRLGNSLGINLLPQGGKLCNFDCIYCECGWNKDGREDRRLPSEKDFRDALESKLEYCVRESIPIDSITFSGDGEPTLNPEFPQIIDSCLELRDRYYPAAKVSVLSNATKVWKPEIAAALKKVDNPILKIDAPDNSLAEKINRPNPGYDVRKVVESLRTFDGNFILQTMFLSSPDFDSTSPEVLDGWMDIVRELRPRQIMVYTIDRNTPMPGLGKFSVERMRSAVQPLIDEGFDIQIRG